MFLLLLPYDPEQQYVCEEVRFALKLYDCLSVYLFHSLSLTKLLLLRALIFVVVYSHCHLYNFFIYGWWNRFIVSLEAFNINFNCLLDVF